ncbi:MAG: hypothetical protein PHF51_04790 [Candidatus ainarchaeum sp.]|nr:hypothetical protein [Candidatus ainarchaeum sp.]
MSAFDLNRYPELKARLEAYRAIEASRRQDYLPGEIFQYLPPFPRDFYWVKTMVELGMLTDINAIPSEYYKQPELYPRFESTGVDLMLHPPVGRFGAWGFGTYPSEVLLTAKVNETTGVETDTYVIFHTSWLVETYQGLKLDAAYPDSGRMLVNQFSDGTRGVAQNSSDASRYFEAEFFSAESNCSRGNYSAADGRCVWASPGGAECYAAYNETTQACSFTPSPSPDIMLLEPAFPVFQYGWAQKVGLRLKVKPNTPKGKYLVTVSVSSPPKEIRDKWLLEYKLLYTSSTTFGADVPWFNVFVEVQ